MKAAQDAGSEAAEAWALKVAADAYSALTHAGSKVTTEKTRQKAALDAVNQLNAFVSSISLIIEYKRLISLLSPSVA